MPDYSLGETLGPVGGIIPIVVGTLLAFGIMLGISKVLAGKNKVKNTMGNH